jgi:predicted nucleotidyltransferase
MDVNQIRLLILERRDEIKEKFKAEVIGIFGSYARGEEKEKSDFFSIICSAACIPTPMLSSWLQCLR